jgi:superfamily II DNA or RNA helicase
MITLRFTAGTIELTGVGYELPDALSGLSLQHDPRAACYRAKGCQYGGIVRALHANKLPYDDQARRYEELPTGLMNSRPPRPFQTEALNAWLANRGQGIVVLPTGAGKSHLALMAIDAKRRSTLVVVPTLDLVRQWFDLLRKAFELPVGVVGGGEHRVEALTVTTYDSAHLHMENFGHRFGVVVFDECHHLPSEAYALAAAQCLAPFRLGLSATPERTDGKERDLETLVGPLVYRKDIVEMSGEYLADYDVHTVSVELSPTEREEYEAERAIYVGFLRSAGIRMSSPRGWNDFILRSTQSSQGQRAMKAYRRQKELAVAAPAKLEVLWRLLLQHNKDRVLIFTQDNRTAYLISKQFLIPIITHQTKVTERSRILQMFSEGQYNAVVTSKVLNEGVDVPDANVAVIISGTGSVREHVQRLGRILRQRKNKRATLYEVIAHGTNETGTSERRRDHGAYKERDADR